MAAFLPRTQHNTLVLTMLLYLYTSSSQILCILPLAFLQMAAFSRQGALDSKGQRGTHW